MCIRDSLRSEYGVMKLEGPIYIYAQEEIKINGVNFGKNFYLLKDLYGTWTLVQKIEFDDYLAVFCHMKLDRILL